MVSPKAVDIVFYLLAKMKNLGISKNSTYSKIFF